MIVKALILDLDRTLLHTDKSISDYSISVLSRCRERGIKLIIATARPRRAVTRYAVSIKPDAVVWHNGAAVTIGGELRSVHPVGSEKTRKILHDIAALYPAATLSAEIGDVLYANFDVTRHWESAEAVQTDFTDLPDTPAYKIIVGVDGMERIDAIAALLPDDVYIEMSDGKLGLITDRNATKLRGVTDALGVFGVDLSEAAAFGDDYADIELLRACGCGVAVENALPEVKTAADFICGSNDDDGVAKWIERNV